MKNSSNNQKRMYRFLPKTSKLFLIGSFLLPLLALAQSADEVRWKSESEVRAMYGEPSSITPPTGTFATYTLWKYENFTVAFADNRAFHLFKNDSLHRLELEEERPSYE